MLAFRINRKHADRDKREVLNEFEAAWNQVVTEKSAGADFAAIWNDHSTFHQNYSIWSQLGYLASR
jgi:hypothetical protein